MMTSEQVAKVYDTLVCIPGMNDPIKLDLKISRRQVLLLTHILDRGLKEEIENPSGIFSIMTLEATDELAKISSDCLEKAGLTKLNERLNSFNSI